MGRPKGSKNKPKVKTEGTKKPTTKGTKKPKTKATKKSKAEVTKKSKSKSGGSAGPKTKAAKKSKPAAGQESSEVLGASETFGGFGVGATNTVAKFRIEPEALYEAARGVRMKEVSRLGRHVVAWKDTAPEHRRVFKGIASYVNRRVNLFITRLTRQEGNDG